MVIHKHKLPALPDYDNCLVNLANSILKRFGAETTARTLPLADKYLEGIGIKNNADKAVDQGNCSQNGSDSENTDVTGSESTLKYKNVVILLLDALGTSILEKHLDKDGFFRSHLAGSFHSVYPPTTVAATTSVMSGLYPNEHGWLGWDMYYPELNKNVTVFTNTDQLKEKEGAKPAVGASGEKVWGEDSLEESKASAEFNAGFTFTPYKSIVDKINDAGGRAYFSMPFMPPYPGDLDEILERIEDLCKEPGSKYIYAYWNEPDSTMHRTGTESPETHEMVTGLEKRIEEFASGLSDTLLFIIADHGHIDSKNLCILDHPDIMECLVRLPSCEPRTLNLFVKDECREAFSDLFRKHFGDDFILLTREETIAAGLFGTGKNRAGLEDMIGDFVAVAVSDTSIFKTHYETQEMPGVHAGLTPEEYIIPLIVIINN
ncbi:MAG: alkaline phosphatase family protein [Lachnospiraceae bacterium]|nr:alkaline phosphatase family protein [Lachnospiraceae bacterium]